MARARAGSTFAPLAPVAWAAVLCVAGGAGCAHTEPAPAGGGGGGAAPAGHLTPAKLAYVEAQITELLTNYGPIPILVMDGWSWQIGHNAVAYEEIRRLVKSLQPSCLLTDHAHLADPWDVDVISFEEPRG